MAKGSEDLIFRRYLMNEVNLAPLRKIKNESVPSGFAHFDDENK